MNDMIFLCNGFGGGRRMGEERKNNECIWEISSTSFPPAHVAGSAFLFHPSISPLLLLTAFPTYSTLLR